MASGDFEITATGNVDELIRYFDGLIVSAPLVMRAETVKTAYAMRATVVQAVSKPGTGIHWSGLPNPSSAPGQPPAIQSGHYADSWDVQVIDHPYGTTAYVGTDDPQGWRLELGFVGVDSLGRRYDVAPRPHLGPAITLHEGKWYDNIIGGLLK